MDDLRFASTKIQPPRLRSARIARPQLEARLREALLQRRVVLLLAPAGFGKTCALAAQFEQDGAPLAGSALAWIALDEDDDPQRLFACLVGALEPFDLPWRTAPEALLGQLGESEAGARRVVAELVNALAAADVPHGVIVLDDLHRVQTPGVHAFLDALIERLPPHWTLVLATRAEPPLALARLRVADELAEFSLHDLRFDAAEAHALAAGEAGAQSDPALAARVAELFDRTQGWPAGIRLCLAALRGRPEGAGRLSASGASRIDHHLFDYLAGEVLDDMPAALHDFLVRCSVLPALTTQRCAAVSGDAQAAERLDEIERRGLFVTALDAQERTLVLHDLLREALDERLRERFPAELPSLLQRAAIGEPDPLRRFGFLQRAADFAQAESVLADASEELIMQGSAVEVRRAIEQFPAEWRAASPRLLRLRTACLAQGWQWGEMAQSAEAAVAAARAAGSEIERQLAQAYLAAAWHSMGRHQQCMDLLDELRPQPLEPAARLLFLTSECSMLFRRGMHAELPAAYAELLEGLERDGSLFVWWSCGPSSAWLSVRGMRPLIQRFCRGALQRVGERELAMRADVRMLQAWALFWSGEIDAARAEAEIAASDVRWLAGSANMEGNLLVFHAIADAIAGRVDAVNQMLDAWLARAAGLDPDSALAWCNDTASFAIRMNDVLGSGPAEFERWARHLKFGVPDPAQIETNAAASSGYAARHAAAERRWDDAAALYQRLLPMAASLDSLGQANELHLRAAHALLQCGQLDAAAAALSPALERIRNAGERGHALMAGPVVLRVLADAPWGEGLAPVLRDELSAIAAFADALRRGEGNATPSNVSASSSGAAGTTLDSSLSAREREVLERIAAGDSNKIIARILDISPHTVKRHVGNILDKLGLASRGQAAAWLREHG
jgi:LuxR family maltose regulon positive regulatory protein